MKLIIVFLLFLPLLSQPAYADYWDRVYYGITNPIPGLVVLIILMFFTYYAPVFRLAVLITSILLVIIAIFGSSGDSLFIGILGAILFVTALVGELKHVSFDKGEPLFKNKNSPPPPSSKPSQKKFHPGPERTIITKVNYQGSEEVAHPKNSSKITDPLILQCQKCDQSLNVPKGKKLKVSCPKCGHSWVYNGIAATSDTYSETNDTGNGESFREKHRARIERREQRLAEEKKKKEEELQAEENRKTEQKRKDREDRLMRRENVKLDAAIKNTIPEVEATLVSASVHAPLHLPRCPECNQMLNIDKREACIICPMCGFIWNLGAVENSNKNHAHVLEKNSCAIQNGVLVEHVGIEVDTGKLKTIFPSGSNVPCELKAIFTVAENLRAHFGVNIYRGLAENTSDAIYLGRCELEIHPHPPSGGLEIETIFGISETDIWFSARSMIGGYNVSLVIR